MLNFTYAIFYQISHYFQATSQIGLTLGSTTQECFANKFLAHHPSQVSNHPLPSEQLSKQKIPIIGVIGKKESDNGDITLRFLDSKKQSTLSFDELKNMIHSENDKYL